MTKKRVMVAIDESKCSHHALQWTLEYLKDSLADSDFILLTVVDHDFSNLLASTYGAAPVEMINSLQENREKRCLALLEKGIKICAESGVTPETVMEHGYPKEAICGAVDKYRVDLLIVGSHSKGPIQRAFLGSVSNYCVNHASCPVLVVRQKA